MPIIAERITLSQSHVVFVSVFGVEEQKFLIGYIRGNDEGYAVLNLEVSEFSSFRDIKKNHFVAAAEVSADINDSITRKRISVSLNQVT